MIASAPGKLVLSGAYAVLRGAPALVAAVDRRVMVDAEREAIFETPEVSAGLQLFDLGGRKHPWFDASALRDEGRKLGLGSSAAICAASLFALWYEGCEAPPNEEEWARTIFPIALRAHRMAQGGGSGIDVAAACFGGILEFRLDPSSSDGIPQLDSVGLPRELVVEVWASERAASTSEFVQRVFATESTSPQFSEALARQSAASRMAAEAVRALDVLHFIVALRSQVQALFDLGSICNVPIVLPEVWALHQALDSASCFLPSGAGGGDVTLYFGRAPSDSSFRHQAQRAHLHRVDLALGAPGLRRGG